MSDVDDARASMIEQLQQRNQVGVLAMVLGAAFGEARRFALADVLGMHLAEPEHDDGPPERTSCVVTIGGFAYRVEITDA